MREQEQLVLISDHTGEGVSGNTSGSGEGNSLSDGPSLEVDVMDRQDTTPHTQNSLPQAPQFAVATTAKPVVQNSDNNHDIGRPTISWELLSSDSTGTGPVKQPKKRRRRSHPSTSLSPFIHTQFLGQ